MVNIIDLGAAYGTAKSGIGIASMGVLKPDMIMKSIVPIIMAGILGIYGLIVAVILLQKSKEICYLKVDSWWQLRKLEGLQAFSRWHVLRLLQPGKFKSQTSIKALVIILLMLLDLLYHPHVFSNIHKIIGFRLRYWCSWWHGRAHERNRAQTLRGDDPHPYLRWGHRSVRTHRRHYHVQLMKDQQCYISDNRHTYRETKFHKLTCLLIILT